MASASSLAGSQRGFAIRSNRRRSRRHRRRHRRSGGPRPRRARATRHGSPRPRENPTGLLVPRRTRHTGRSRLGDTTANLEGLVTDSASIVVRRHAIRIGADAARWAGSGAREAPGIERPQESSDGPSETAYRASLTSRAMRSAAESWSSCSHTTTTVQPSSVSRAVVSASRATVEPASSPTIRCSISASNGGTGSGARSRTGRRPRPGRARRRCRRCGVVAASPAAGSASHVGATPGAVRVRRRCPCGPAAASGRESPATRRTTPPGYLAASTNSASGSRSWAQKIETRWLSCWRSSTNWASARSRAARNCSPVHPGACWNPLRHVRLLVRP